MAYKRKGLSKFTSDTDLVLAPGKRKSVSFDRMWPLYQSRDRQTRGCCWQMLAALIACTFRGSESKLRTNFGNIFL